MNGKYVRVMRGLAIVAVVTVLLAGLTGCTVLKRAGVGQPGGVMGTGVGDGNVSDDERSAMNLGYAGSGDVAQRLLGKPPQKPAGQQFPQVGVITNNFDALDTPVTLPIRQVLVPIYGSVTNVLGLPSAPATPANDELIRRMLEDYAAGRLAVQPGTNGVTTNAILLPPPGQTNPGSSSAVPPRPKIPRVDP